MSSRVRAFAELSKWIDDRTGYRALLRGLLYEEIPGGARWAYVFGAVLLGLIALQIATGLLLMTVYSPSAQTAWGSVYYIQYRVTLGWLVRGLHHYGAQAMIVVLALHVLQVTAYGAHRAPREFNFWLGLGLLGLVLVFALTGYLLPWDQKGYWATRVATSIAGTVPAVGGALQTLAQGGATYGSLTLTRFYALHVAVLPAALVGLVVAHVYLFRRHRVTPPASADPTRIGYFWPDQASRDTIAAAIAILACFVLAARTHGASLDAPADPTSDYPARPDWYFLALFQLLKYFHGPLEIVGTVVVPGLATALLLSLPLWDRAPIGVLRTRAAQFGFVCALVAGAIGLTVLSLRADASDAGFQGARRRATARADRAIAVAAAGIPPEGPLEMLRHDPLTRGAELFVEHCAPCHRMHGEGANKASDLGGFASRAWIVALLENPRDDRFFGHTKLRTMPPQRRIGEDGRRAAAEFLHAEGVEPGDPETVDEALRARGEGIFRERCIHCHLYRGEGRDTEEGPEMAGYGSRAWLRAQIRDAAAPDRYGARNEMVRFAERLGEDDVEMIVGYLRAERLASVIPHRPSP